MQHQAIRFLAGIAALTISTGASAQASSPTTLSVEDLRWDGKREPLGLIQFEPRISWAVSSDRRGDKQTAYQILVASDPHKLVPGKADLWDSGKVVSDQTLNVRYGGQAPVARERAYWTLRVWDAQGRPSAFAKPTWWEMGLYDEEWEGQWIGRPRGANEASEGEDRSVTYLRKSFVLKSRVVKARLYASAFGVYSFRINGKPAHDTVLSPGYTDYEKRVLFQTYDVTALLKPGANVLGAMVAGGWCTLAARDQKRACGQDPPRVMAQLEVTLANGERQIVISDPSWKAHDGPVRSAHLTEGENYDARKEIAGWDTNSTSDESWPQAVAYDTKKERDLVADTGPSARVWESLKPVRVTATANGAYFFDIGKSMVGWAKLEAHAAKDRAVILRYGSALTAKGELDPKHRGGSDSYVPKSTGPFAWQPSFTLHSFRYVEVQGLSRAPNLDALKGQVVHSEMPRVGTLETSSPELNQLVENIDSAQRAGFLSIPGAVGPGRQRHGDLLQGRAFALTGCLNRDVARLYRKWIDDIRDAQFDNAAYASFAPRVDAQEGGPGAGTAGVLVPWAFHQCYADQTAVDAHLASMGRYLDSIAKQNPDLIWRKGRGQDAADVNELSQTSKDLVATADFIEAAQAVAAMAALGGPNLQTYVRRYEGLAKQSRAQFAKQFMKADGKLESDTQTAYALAIGMNVLNDTQVARSAPHFVAALERSAVHPTTGILGSAYLLPALSRIGRDDLAYKLLLSSTCPSWSCAAAGGVATLPQSWQKADSTTMQGFALGSVGQWIFDAVGGIALDPAKPAGKHFFVRPRPASNLTHAKASYGSRHGLITTQWRRQAGSFLLDLNLPANTSATVTLPYAGRVRESGSALEKAEGIEVVASTPLPVFRVQSGHYKLEVLQP